MGTWQAAGGREWCVCVLPRDGIIGDMWKHLDGLNCMLFYFFVLLRDKVKQIAKSRKRSLGFQGT